MKNTRTRAQVFHVRPRLMQRRTHRALDGLRERIRAIADPWADLDEGMNLACEELLAAVDSFQAALAETVTILESPAP